MAAGDDVVDLAAQAAAKTAEIQAEKCRIRDGGFVVDGVLFDSDQAARTSYLELALRFGVDPAFSTRWKASAGVWVAMDATLFARVQAMGTAHMQAAFAWQEARDAELAAILAQAAAGTMNQAEAVAALRGVPERFS
jgi:phosphoglycolate phosphatase-like HAD superfamily hydrolase